MTQLHQKTIFAYDALLSSLKDVPMTITSVPQSPMIHLTFTEQYRSQLNLPLLYGNSTFVTKGKPAKFLNPFDEYFNLENFMLQKVIDYVLKEGKILLTRSKLILEHEDLPVLPPQLLVNINNGVSEEELKRLADILPKAVDEVVSNITNEDELFELTDELINY